MVLNEEDVSELGEKIYTFYSMDTLNDSISFIWIRIRRENDWWNSYLNNLIGNISRNVGADKNKKKISICFRIYFYYYCNSVTMISLKVLLTLCIILQLASSANSIPGCLSEITDKYGEKKCVRCFVNMGFTSEFKCEFCKKGFFISGGVCKKMP